MQVRPYQHLHHNHAGVVSLSGDASEVAISLTRALYLDSSYQVSLSAMDRTLCSRSCKPAPQC